jgi:hypothetical protein
MYNAMNGAVTRAAKIQSVVARLALLAALPVAVAAFAVPAHAADAVFPIGSRIGLVPPAGMTPSQSFLGFADPQQDAAILINTLPAEAYDPLEKSGLPDTLRKQGIIIEKREPFDVQDGKAFLITGTEAADKARYRKWLLVAALSDLTALVSIQVPQKDTTYSDNVIRGALATLAVRKTVPDAERLRLVPFTVAELAGFHVSDVIPGRAVMLIDARDDQKPDPAGFPINARLLIAAMPGGPSEPSDWANFAREIFNTIIGIKDIHIQMSEPLRIASQSGYQTLASAKDNKTDADVMVVQWLRFGTGGFMQMIGISRADIWSDEFPRLRAVRDGIDLK